ncbi:MAG TPA: hypothetical protein VLV31_04230 [Candidatus Acidoferrales bacterium]|nr:hypothetical protein [Candidatus Acidoferrales bacterium]
MRTIVREYILAKGNREAAEVLEDYVQYLHYHGYVIRRDHNRRRRTITHRRYAKKPSTHLQPRVSMRPKLKH